MQPVVRSVKLLQVLLGLVALMAVVPAVSAAAIPIAASNQRPVVGEQVTYTATYVTDCAETLVWSVDGDAQAPTDSPTFRTAFATAGSHTVAVAGTSTCGPSYSDSGSLPVTVRDGIAGTIATTPDPVLTGKPATLAVSQTGGYAPYTWAWDTDDDGSYDDGTTRTVTSPAYARGPHVVRVRIRDAAGHQTTTERTLQVVDTPPPGAPAPEQTPEPAPGSPECVQRLAFALSELKTTGCFARTSQTEYQTTSAVTLNGISFPDYGQTFTITLPTGAEPGGHLRARDAAIVLGDFTAYSGDVDWALPAGSQGEERQVATVELPPVAELFGLHVAGTTAVRLGQGADGGYYAIFPLHVELPAIFKTAPDPSARGVTADAALRVDDAGPHYDGLKLKIEDAVFLGRLRVPEACFSYVPAGGTSTTPCEKPSLDGQPYLTCASDTTTDRWDGNAVIELPIDPKVTYAAFGGLAGGQLASLGGFADNLSAGNIAVAPGVLLNRLGAGVCLTPPPLKLRGDIGVTALDDTLRVDGRFLYTDPFGSRPWQIEAGGKVVFGDTELGNGSVRFNPWGAVGFGIETNLDLLGVASFTGSADGWIEGSRDLFDVAGSGTGCLATVICADASGVVSSTGVAGCIDAGEIVLYEPVRPRKGPFGWGSISFGVREHRYPIKAGFGFKYGSSVDLLGNACDFSPYSASTAVARTAQSGFTQRIAEGAKAVTLRVHGSDGPPKLVVRGPGGTTITSAADAPGVQRKGAFVLAENATDGTTSVLLVKPAAGRWTITAAPGSASTPTRVDRSDYEAPAMVVGQTRRTKRGRQVALAYAAPAGTQVRLVERGRGITRTLVDRVKGRPCRGRRTLPGGRRLRCARLTFRPSRGPGGTRRVQAIVTRGGLQVSRVDVVAFTAPRERLPSRPGRLRARRVKGALVVGFPRAKGASRYSVTAALGDGRRIGYDLRGRCRAVRIADVPRGVGATVEVAGMRYDLRLGRARSIRVKAGTTSAGRKGRLPRRVCT